MAIRVVVILSSSSSRRGFGQGGVEKYVLGIWEEGEVLYLVEMGLL
jgi:hypothetical protein